jgi:hypothetical protein
MTLNTRLSDKSCTILNALKVREVLQCGLSLLMGVRRE